MSTLKKLERIEKKLKEIKKLLSMVRGTFIYVCGFCGEPYQKKGDLKLHCSFKHGKEWNKEKMRSRKHGRRLG